MITEQSTYQSNACISSEPNATGETSDPWISLILAILPILVSRQINLFRQWGPATHPHVDLLRIEVAGQRLQPVDVVAIHDPWLVVEMRRDSRGNGGLGSGDLLDG